MATHDEQVALGRLIAAAREKAGMTQAELAEHLGYTSAVMVSKIEAGTRFPADDKVALLAETLGLDEEAVQAARGHRAGRARGAQALVAATKLAAENRRKAVALRRRAQEAKQRVDQAATDLEAWSSDRMADLVGQFTSLSSRVRDVPDSLLVPPRVEDGSGDAGTNREALEETQVRTSSYLRDLLFKGAAGSAAGAAAGGAAAAATYSAVASLATASTGTAIATLSGIAAQNATLAWLGGGSLAVGGAGIAGGTAVLTGIVAVPAIGLAAIAILAGGGRILAQQEQVAARIEQAEKDFDRNLAIMDRFVQRASGITYALKFGITRAESSCKAAEDELDSKGQNNEEAVLWSGLSAGAQGALSTVAAIITTCLTLTSLPIALVLEEDTEPGHTADVAADIADEIPKVRPRLAEGKPEVNRFIDYTITESIGQLART